MKLSGWTGIPYGTVFNGNFAGHPSVNEIRSDGCVDSNFCQPGDDFIRSVDDKRVQDFLVTGMGPHPGWEKQADGSWSFEHQSLSLKAGNVTLKSWIWEDGSRVTHHIEAPYRWDCGEVFTKKSTEGFKITAS